MAINNNSDHAQNTFRHIRRRVLPLVVAAFVVIGLVGMFGVRAGAYNNLEDAHSIVLGDVSREMADEFEQATTILNTLAADDTIRRYAQEADGFSRSALFLRNSALGLLVTEANESPENIRWIRYLNADGEILLEVENAARNVEARTDTGRTAPAGLYRAALQSQPGAVNILSPRTYTEIVQPEPLSVPVFSMTVPVFTDEEPNQAQGVIQVELSANQLLDVVTMAPTSPLLGEPGRRVLLLNSAGLPLADSEIVDVGALIAGSLPTTNTSLGTLLDFLAANPGILTSTNVNNQIVSTATIDNGLNAPDMPWRLVLADNSALIFSSTNTLSTAILILALVVGIIIAGGLNMALQRTLQPFERAAQLAQQLAGGQADITAQDGESDVLTLAMSQMSGQIKEMTAENETQRNRLRKNLEIAARVSQETASQNDLDALLNRVLDLICVEYQFHHAQIFMLDDTGTNVGLAYTYDEMGREMLGQGLRVPVDPDSTVLTVIEEDRYQINNNIIPGRDLTRSPLTTATRSRILLPLRAYKRPIGVLDIQSATSNLFQDDEIQAFTLLADQVSQAIHSHQLARATDDQAQQITTLNRELTQKTWENVEDQLDLERAFHYDLRQIRTGEGQTEAETAINMPINIRGHEIGSLAVAPRDGESFTPDEEAVLRAVTDRVALAIDRARLFQETQISLSETSLLYDMARRINEASDLNHIIEAIITSVMPHAIGGQIIEMDRRAYHEAPTWASVTAEWYNPEHDTASHQDTLMGLRLRLADHAFLSEISNSDATLIDDVQSYDGVDDAFLQIMDSLGARGLVVLPLTIRGAWHGAVLVEFAQPQHFTAQEKRVYSVLVDQASVSIDNSLLLQRTEVALRETNRLYSASRAISSAADLTAVYEETVSHLVGGANAINRIMILLARPDPVPDAPTFEYVYDWVDGKTQPAGNLVAADNLPYPEIAQAGAVLIEDVLSDLPNLPEVSTTLLNDKISSLVVTPLQSRQNWFGWLVCATDQPGALDESYSQFVQTVGDQVAIAIENQSLIQTSEAERQTLSSILGTMPSGVLVLDAETYLPIQANEQIELLLGKPVNMHEPFSAVYYNLYRTGTSLHYTDADLPIFQITEGQDLAFSDDLVVIHPDGTQIDLLLNAAPIHETDGSVNMIVAAFENISSLRGLENALQDNLRETIGLYEATRSLAEADETDDVLDAMIMQVVMIEPDDAAVILIDDDTETNNIVRTLNQSPDKFELPAALLNGHQPVWINNIAQANGLDDAERETLIAHEILAIATTPLRARSREAPLGWIVVAYSEPRNFEAEEDRYLTTLADSAATALDNRLLFQSTEAALREASVLYQANRALADVNNNDDVLNAVVAHLVHEGIDHAFMALLSGVTTWEAAGASATVEAGWIANDNVVDLQGVSLSPDQFPAWDLLAASEPQIIDDVSQAEGLDDMQRMGIESLGAQSVVIMPLRTANRILGVLWMGGPIAHAYTERDLRIFQSFAEQASISLDATLLYEQAERRAGQLQTSAQVSQFASSILDLEMLLPRLVNLIKTAFSYDHVQIFLMDNEERYAELRASTGDAGRQLLDIKHKLEKGSTSVIGTVTAEGRPVIALDTGAVDVVHRPNPHLPDTRSEIALPLVIKNRIVGALDVQSNQANAFADEDVEVLTTLAAQISVAIDNADLFEQAEHRASDMSLLFAVTTAAASSESLSEALANVVNDLRDSLRSLSVAIYLPVEYIDDVSGDTRLTMRAEAVAGYEDSLETIAEVPVDNQENIIGISAGNMRANIINLIDDEPRYHPLLPNAQSAVVVPLTSAAQIIGLVVMENADPYAYNHETLTLLQTMGGTLTALIQNQQLLEQLQESNDQLLEMDRIKSEFLANMSHELRTPLNSIIGFSRVILKGIDGPLTEMQEQDLTTIYSSGQHLLNLINDILDQAKIASGKMEIKPEYFDIKAVVEAVRSIGIGLVKDKPVDIKIELESGLPEVYGDEFRTRQVLLNLLSNAGKFTNEGAITLSVYRQTNPDTGQNMVRVDVADSGIGIAEKDLPLLFEAFRQVDSSLTRTAGGTGLGLPISKSLIEMQGGEMMVSSQVNVGSIFSITIPVDAPEGADEPEAEDMAGPLISTNGHSDNSDTVEFDLDSVQTQPPDDDKRRTASLPGVMPVKRQVLVIEDNPDRVDQFRRAIQREGFDVFAASIPLEAEAMASGLRPSLITMDVNFANGAGWDILQKIKERDDTFDIPVIVVTLSDERERALDLGAFAFLQHPILPEDLVEVVLEAERESNTDRILIIDDQPESARLLKEVLNEHGHYRVFEAHDGIEGVSLVARRRPDLVILDLRMPEKDGFEVLEELRSNAETANIPVLVVTGDTLNTDEEHQLAGVEVMSKTDISLAESRQFIEDVQTRLTRNGD